MINHKRKCKTEAILWNTLNYDTYFTISLDLSKTLQSFKFAMKFFTGSNMKYKWYSLLSSVCQNRLSVDTIIKTGMMRLPSLHPQRLELITHLTKQRLNHLAWKPPL